MFNVVGKNGELNGIFAAQFLLGEDMLFFNPGEIDYDGNNHIIRGIQINANKINEIPELIEYAETLAMGLVDCMMFVEENEKLKCDIEKIDESLHPYINHENLTGITLMHLFAWHLLQIKEQDVMGDAIEKVLGKTIDKNDYTIIGDTRVLNGIPNSHEMIDELVHTVLRYNDEDRKISIDYVGMTNLDI